MSIFEQYQRAKRQEAEQIKDCHRLAEYCGLTIEQRAKDSISWVVREDGEQRFTGMLVHCHCYLQGFDQANNTRGRR